MLLLTPTYVDFDCAESKYVGAKVNWGVRFKDTEDVDLVGGYYDAGDNVKFRLPMAFTVTMMSWSILEYGKQMASSGELGHAMDAVKLGTDYLIKAHPLPHVLYEEIRFSRLLLFRDLFVQA